MSVIKLRLGELSAVSPESAWQSWMRSPSHGSSTSHTEPGRCLCSFLSEVNRGSRGQSLFCQEVVPAAIPSQPLSEWSSAALSSVSQLRGSTSGAPEGVASCLCSLRVCAVGRADPPVLVTTAGQEGQDTAPPGHGLFKQCSVEPSSPWCWSLLPFKKILNY